MDNGKLTYPIEDKVNETDEFEKFKQMIDAVNDKEALTFILFNIFIAVLYTLSPYMKKRLK